MRARYHRIEAAVGIVGLTLFVAYFGLLCFTYPWKGDIQRHSAAVASLYIDFFHPPHEAVAAPGYTSDVHTPYIVAVAAFGRLLHVTPYRALQLAGVLNLVLYAWAIWFFFRTFSIVRESWLPPILFLVVSLCMRQGVYWWASETSFQSLQAIQAYPSLFAWGLALAAFQLAQRSAQQVGWRLVLLAGLVWTLLLSHNITASWVVGIIGVIGLAEVIKSKGASPARTRVLLLYAATAAGAVLTYVWPYFDIMGSSGLLQFQEGSEFADHPFRDMAPLYVLAAVASVWLLRARQHTVIMAGFAATWLALQVWRHFGFSYGNRYAFFQAFFAQVLVAEVAAIGLLQVFQQWTLVPDAQKLGAKLRWLEPVFAVAAIALSLTAPIMRGPVAGFRTLLALPSAHDAYYQRLGLLPRRLGRHDVVLMPFSYSTWDVASITGARVVIAPFAYRLPDFAQRVEDARRFFDTRSDSQVRAEIIERYKVSKVLLTPGYLDLAGELGPHEGVHTREGLWILVDASGSLR